MEKMMKDLDSIYPLTIISDRYNGVYSGGKYTAWPLFYYQVPREPEESDIDCSLFWETYCGVVGKGNTIQEALVDLASKMGKN